MVRLAYGPVSVGYEYISGVFGVGLEGFADYDHEELNAYGDLGWEPFMVTAVHNGMAALILFRRPLPARRPARKAPAKKVAAKKVAAKKAPAKKAAADKSPSRRPQ